MNRQTIEAAKKLIEAINAFDYAVRADADGKDVQYFTMGLLPSLDRVRFAAEGIAKEKATTAVGEKKERWQDGLQDCTAITPPGREIDDLDCVHGKSRVAALMWAGRRDGVSGK